MKLGAIAASRRRTVAGALTISTAPTLAGAPVVGQVILATSGTYSAAADSVTRTWTLGGVVIDGQTDDALLINDIYAGGGVIGYSEVAHKTGYSDSAANPAVPTAAVALIDLTNAITAFTRTSSSGVTPMTWSITFGSNVYAGYWTRWQVFSTSAKADNPPLQDVHYRLTNDDLQPGANIQAVLAAAGLTAPTATQWLDVTVYTQSPNNLGFLYQVPDPISPTDAAVPMTWSPTDHSASMVLSGGNLTISSPGTWSVARTNRGIGAGKKVYVEMTGDCYVGVADASATLADAHLGAGGDGTATIHASEYQVFGQLIGFNGSNIAAPSPWTAPADVKGITLDTTGANPVVTYYLNNVVQGSRTLTGISSPLFFMTTMPNGKSTTLISGTPGLTTGFTYTPPAGFVAP